MLLYAALLISYTISRVNLGFGISHQDIQSAERRSWGSNHRFQILWEVNDPLYLLSCRSPVRWYEKLLFYIFLWLIDRKPHRGEEPFSLTPIFFVLYASIVNLVSESNLIVYLAGKSWFVLWPGLSLKLHISFNTYKTVIMKTLTPHPSCIFMFLLDTSLKS